MKYLLIMGSEDGEPCMFLDNIEDVLGAPEDYGIEKFLTSIPGKDPNYWKDGDALLLRIEVLSPLPVVSDDYTGFDRRKDDHFHGAFGRKEGGHIWTQRKDDK